MKVSQHILKINRHAPLGQKNKKTKNGVEIYSEYISFQNLGLPGLEMSSQNKPCCRLIWFILSIYYIRFLSF